MLRFETLPQWQAWQQHQAGLARRMWRARKGPSPGASPLYSTSWEAGDRGSVLVALDATSPSLLAALVEPARRLLSRGYGVSVVSTAPVLGLLDVPGQQRRIDARQLDETLSAATRAVLSAGDYLPAGAASYRAAKRLGIEYLVVQHGVITPLAPPLPAGAHLLAWSVADLDFWRNGNAKVAGTVCGSQILWQAARRSDDADDAVAGGTRAVDARRSSYLTFLGQLHGLELPRRTTRQSIDHLRREASVLYRPHPGETDILSRVQHEVWRRRGVVVGGGEGSLLDVPGPVLAHFSTGILEAAAAGIPAYAYCARPPGWLLELWDRYHMSQWGTGEPTRVAVPAEEPATLIADLAEAIIR